MTLLLTIALLFGTQIVVDPPKPKDDLKQREAYQHYVRGQEFLSSERFEKAVEEFQAATSSIRLHRRLLRLGHAYMGLRRYASAAQAYERCLSAAQTIFGMREQNRGRTDQLITDQLRALREALAQTSKMARRPTQRRTRHRKPDS